MQRKWEERLISCSNNIEHENENTNNPTSYNYSAFINGVYAQAAQINYFRSFKLCSSAYLMHFGLWDSSASAWTKRLLRGIWYVQKFLRSVGVAIAVVSFVYAYKIKQMSILSIALIPLIAHILALRIRALAIAFRNNLKGKKIVEIILLLSTILLIIFIYILTEVSMP